MKRGASNMTIGYPRKDLGPEAGRAKGLSILPPLQVHWQTNWKHYLPASFGVREMKTGKYFLNCNPLLIFQEGQKTFDDVVKNDPDNAKPFAMIMLRQLMTKAQKDVETGTITLDQG